MNYHGYSYIKALYMGQLIDYVVTYEDGQFVRYGFRHGNRFEEPIS